MNALLALILLAAAASTIAIPLESATTPFSSIQSFEVTENAMTAQEIEDWETVLAALKEESEKATAKERLESLLLKPQFAGSRLPSQQFINPSLLTNAQFIPQLSNGFGSQCLLGDSSCGFSPISAFSSNFGQQNPPPTFVETDDWSKLIGQITSSKDPNPSTGFDWRPNSNLYPQGWNFIPNGQGLFGGQ